MVGDLTNLITCAKFQDEIFRGYDFTADRMCHFCMSLTTVQRYCAACDFQARAGDRDLHVTLREMLSESQHVLPLAFYRLLSASV